MRFRRPGRRLGNAGDLAGGVFVDRRANRRRSPFFTVLFFGALIWVVWMISQSWLRGEGVVDGNTVEVAPTIKGRIERLYAACDERVARGAVIADLTNDVVISEFDRGVARLRLDLASVEQEKAVVAAEIEEARQKARAERARVDQTATQLAVYAKLRESGDIAPLLLVRQQSEAQGAEANAAAAESSVAARQRELEKKQRQERELREVIAKTAEPGEASGRITLRAPQAGLLTNCKARVGEVIDGNQSIYRIFDPAAAYITGYFAAADIRKLSPGQTVTARIAGTPTELTARVTFVNPRIGSLPEHLQRFFWQRPQWTQYGSIRVDLSDQPREIQEQLSFGAHAQLSLANQSSLGERMLDQLRPAVALIRTTMEAVF